MTWKTEARLQIQRVLDEYPRRLLGCTKEAAIELLCDELKKIPIPFLGTILAAAVKRSLSHGTQDLAAILRTLRQMKQSDADLGAGLGYLGEDVERLGTVIQTVRRELETCRRDLLVPNLVIRNCVPINDFPVFKNRLCFSLMNLGGGAVTVPEIYLDVEKWEPKIELDYTAPAAPPAELHLSVWLDPSCTSYPVLSLNNQSYRRFGAFSEGAEDITVYLSTGLNVQYLFRLRIPYQDLSSGAVHELIYPPAEEPPLRMVFPYAPGWQGSVEPTMLLNVADIVKTYAATLDQACRILAASPLADDLTQRERLDQQLRDIGFTMGLDFMTYVLKRILPSVAILAQDTHPRAALCASLRLIHLVLQQPYQAFFEPSWSPETVAALTRLCSHPADVAQVELFFATDSVQEREHVLAHITASPAVP